MHPIQYTIFTSQFEHGVPSLYESGHYPGTLAPICGHWPLREGDVPLFDGAVAAGGDEDVVRDPGKALHGGLLVCI